MDGDFMAPTALPQKFSDALEAARKAKTELYTLFEDMGMNVTDTSAVKKGDPIAKFRDVVPNLHMKLTMRDGLSFEEIAALKDNDLFKTFPNDLFTACRNALNENYAGNPALSKAQAALTQYQEKLTEAFAIFDANKEAPGFTIEGVERMGAAIERDNAQFVATHGRGWGGQPARQLRRTKIDPDDKGGI